MAFKFEKLEVWKLAIDLADEIHLITNTFPKKEIFSLTSQMNRAVNSISLNIVEGSTGQTNPEQRRFLGYAQRSALEVVNCLYLANRRKYITKEIFEKQYGSLETLIKKIQALKNFLK
jgi:four helix bundle protein